MALVNPRRDRRGRAQRQGAHAFGVVEKLPGVRTSEVAQQGFAGEPGAFAVEAVAGQGAHDHGFGRHVLVPGHVEPAQRGTELGAELPLGQRGQPARVRELRQGVDGPVH